MNSILCNSNLFFKFDNANRRRTELENSLTNPIFRPTKPVASFEKLNDIGFRLILIPFFGIGVPLLTGMYKGISLSHWELKLSFAYNIGIAFLIWQGNRYLLFTLRSYFDWFNHPVRKVVVLLVTVSFYTIPVSALLLMGWYQLFGGGKVNGDVVFSATCIIMVCVIFITHVYETVFLVKESESEIIRNEQLEKAKVKAELEALKNQIDPHFIFNSLNTLGYLIEDNPDKARQFNESMADVFRYILQNKGRNLVMLREEIQFLQEYFSLLTIRFEKAVFLKISVPEAQFDQFLLPPISLQVLAENAIKHNEFSEPFPLVIHISLTGEELTISNPIRKKGPRKKPTQIGLQNLAERYRLITDKSINIWNTEKDFTVTLPVLRLV
jgi:hypothetical protein